MAAVAGTLVTEPEPTADREATRSARPDPPLVRRVNLLLAGAIVLAGVALLPVWRPLDAGLQAPAGVVGNAPPGITTALRDLVGPGDRVFNPQPWGSWFEFALPDLPVAIDSRIEVFPVEVWDDLRAGGRRCRWMGSPARRLARDDRGRGGRRPGCVHGAARGASAGARRTGTQTGPSSSGSIAPRPSHGSRVPSSRRPLGTRGPARRAGRVALMTEPRPDLDLDLVVLGGGGHVGLPLSLAFAEAGLRVGIYDTNQATLDRIAAGEMPFLEAGADELLRTLLPSGRLALRVGRVDDRPDRPARGGHRHSCRRVPRAVDDRLREGRRPDRTAPARRRAGRPSQHRLSRHHRLRRPASCRPRLHGERRVLSRADRGGPCARGAPHAAPDRRRRRRPGRRAGCRPVRAPRVLDDPHELEGGRARQALHEHVALHEVRRRQPVPDDRGPGRRGLHERPSRGPRGLPARRGPAGSGLRRRSVPVQGHDAARRLHLGPLPARPGGHAGQRRVCPPTSSLPSNAATAGSRARPSASWAWPSRANRTTRAHR